MSNKNRIKVDVYFVTDTVVDWVYILKQRTDRKSEEYKNWDCKSECKV